MNVLGFFFNNLRKEKATEHIPKPWWRSLSIKHFVLFLSSLIFPRRYWSTGAALELLWSQESLIQADRDPRLSVFQVYIIEVTDGEHKWTVKHRYSDFHDLHEKVSAWSRAAGGYFSISN